MFKSLRQKWEVGPLQLCLILCTFAIGGSLSGYAGKWLLGQFDIDSRTAYIILYIIAVTIIWPVMVLTVSVFFGQYSFFKGYLKNLSKKLRRRRADK